MNNYYILAFVFGAAAILFGYRGATVDSQTSAEEARLITNEQTVRIEGQLKDLGNKIQALSSNAIGPKTEKEIEQIQSEYKEIADAFYKNLPVELEEHKGRSATKTIQQLEKTRQIEPHIHRLETVAKGLASAFNSKNPNTPITIKCSDFPINIFTPSGRKEYETRLSFASDYYWSIHFLGYSDGTPALEFMRLTFEDIPGKERLFFDTPDSLELIMLGDKFKPSLHTTMSDDLKERIMKVIPHTETPMEKFDEVAQAILETVIKHQLFQQSLKP